MQATVPQKHRPEVRWFKSRARNHLPANRLLEFRAEVTVSAQLVITHVQGGVPARLSAEDAHLIGRCTQPGARDRGCRSRAQEWAPRPQGMGRLCRGDGRQARGNRRSRVLSVGYPLLLCLRSALSLTGVAHLA